MILFGACSPARMTKIFLKMQLISACIHPSKSVEAFLDHPIWLISYATLLSQGLTERHSFKGCISLKRASAIIPGVVILGYAALHGCIDLEYVECPKLERIGESAFDGCVPSIKVILDDAFNCCNDQDDARL